jgi:hypothetical protein
VALGLRDAGRTRAKAYDDVYAGILEVVGVCMALRAITDDRDGLTVEQVEVSIVVIEHGAEAT